MSAMFTRFSKFRSKNGSRTVSSQRVDHDDVDDQSAFYNRKPPQPSPKNRRPPPPFGKHVVYETTSFDEDEDNDVTFAETLFPVTPTTNGRQSSDSFLSDEDYSPHKRSTKQSTNGKSWGSGASWDTASRRNGVPETRSWTSSSLPEEEEEINSGPPVLPPYDVAEEDFLEEFEDYFNHIAVDNVRREQFPQLELQKLVYLDYASFSLYSKFQIEQHMKILLEEGPCLGSASVSSSTDNPLFLYVSDTADRLLRMLNTTSEHYSVIFTAGFQESFRLVAESFPFQKGSALLVCQDNHAAVRPVIRAAVRAGGKPLLVPVTEKELCFHSHELHKQLRRRDMSNGGLFIYPAQSNVSGVKHSLQWVVEAQQTGWHVCLDATTLLPTSALDLEIHQPDFVVGSFHHMIGYPSGMGFLLVRRESFGVRAAASGALTFVRNQQDDEHCHILSPMDNTMNLLQFAALNLGLVLLERIGPPAIQARTRALAQWLLPRLRSLRHREDYDSGYLLRVYGSHAPGSRGSILSFNVVDTSGTVLPPEIVRKLAARCNIKLAVGCFNNPGLANLLGAAPHERSRCDVRILERNWGFQCVRASLGAVSTFSDAYRLVQFLSRFRDEEYLAGEALEFIQERNQNMER